MNRWVRNNIICLPQGARYSRKVLRAYPVFFLSPNRTKKKKKINESKFVRRTLGPFVHYQTYILLPPNTVLSDARKKFSTGGRGGGVFFLTRHIFFSSVRAIYFYVYTTIISAFDTPGIYYNISIARRYARVLYAVILNLKT